MVLYNLLFISISLDTMIFDCYERQTKNTFIFGPGRKTKLDENSFKAKEFFMDFIILKSYKTEIIEVFKGSENKKGIRKLLHFFDRVIVKLTNFRSSTIELITINNIRRYKLFDSTIFTTDALFLSFLPIALIYKILRRKNKNYIIRWVFWKKILKYFRVYICLT